MDPIEAGLVANMVRGEVGALRELYGRLSSLVFSLALHITGIEEDAEEVLVDTFFQAWTQAGRYDPDRATVTGWLLNIARSRALDKVRTRKRWEQRRERAAEPAALPMPEFPRDPEQDAMKAEQRSLVLQAIGSLAPDQKRALELAYFAGLSHGEIAEHLGQPLGTIKTRLRLAMRKIRNALRGVDGVEP